MRKKPSRILIWISVIALVLVVAYISFSTYDRYVGIGAPSHPNFSGYIPKTLPNDVQVTGQTLTRERQAGLDVWTFAYRIKVNSPDIYITESQRQAVDRSPVNCTGHSDTCILHQSTNGQVYRVWYTQYASKGWSDLQIETVKQNTLIDITVANTVAPKFINYDWGAVFDSMQQVDLGNMSYNKVTNSGYGG